MANENDELNDWLAGDPVEASGRSNTAEYVNFSETNISVGL